MSTVWLVGSSCQWMEDISVVLSSFFGVRRIASLRSFQRLIALGDIPPQPNFLCVVRILPEDDLLTIHSALSRFVTEDHSSRMCIVGDITQEQRKVAENFRIGCLGIPGDMVQFAKMIRTLTSAPELEKAHVKDDFIRVGDIEVDKSKGCLRILATGFEESLTPKEIKIIQALSSSLNQPIGRDDLLSKVWQGTRVSTNTIDSHMSRLRKKIEKSFECRLETRYGSGWVLSIEK